MSSPLLFPPVCYRRYEIDHFGRLCRSEIDHRRHSTDTGQYAIGTGGQYQVGENSQCINTTYVNGDEKITYCSQLVL